MINLNYHICIFEIMGVAATKPHLTDDVAHRTPSVNVFKNPQWLATLVILIRFALIIEQFKSVNQKNSKEQLYYNVSRSVVSVRLIWNVLEIACSND